MSVLLWLGCLVFGSLLQGAVMKVLWGWFIVPVFGLPAISIAQAIGIGLAVNALISQHTLRDEDEQRVAVVYEFVSPVVLLVIGWVVHLFT